MNSLCDAVRSETVRIFDSVSIEPWEVISTGSHTCQLRIPGVMVDFNVDPRNNLVSSSMIFLDLGDENREKIYSHIIANAFNNIEWHDETGTENVALNVALEVENVKNILTEMKNSKVSPRDLLYFYFGFNSGYLHKINAN